MGRDIPHAEGDDPYAVEDWLGHDDDGNLEELLTESGGGGVGGSDQGASTPHNNPRHSVQAYTPTANGFHQEPYPLQHQRPLPNNFPPHVSYDHMAQMHGAAMGPQPMPGSMAQPNMSSVPPMPDHMHTFQPDTMSLQPAPPIPQEPFAGHTPMLQPLNHVIIVTDTPVSYGHPVPREIEIQAQRYATGAGMQRHFREGTFNEMDACTGGATERRRAQNREAQRRFRMKNTDKTKQLEEKNGELAEKLAKSQRTAGNLRELVEKVQDESEKKDQEALRSRQRIAELEQENARLQAELAAERRDGSQNPPVNATLSRSRSHEDNNSETPMNIGIFGLPVGDIVQTPGHNMEGNQDQPGNGVGSGSLSSQGSHLDHGGNAQMEFGNSSFPFPEEPVKAESPHRNTVVGNASYNMARSTDNRPNGHMHMQQQMFSPEAANGFQMGHHMSSQGVYPMQVQHRLQHNHMQQSMQQQMPLDMIHQQQFHQQQQLQQSQQNGQHQNGQQQNLQQQNPQQNPQQSPLQQDPFSGFQNLGI